MKPIIKIPSDLFQTKEFEQLAQVTTKLQYRTALALWVKLLLKAGRINQAGLVYCEPDKPLTLTALSKLAAIEKLPAVRASLECLIQCGLLAPAAHGQYRICHWRRYHLARPPKNYRGLIKFNTKPSGKMGQQPPLPPAASALDRPSAPLKSAGASRPNAPQVSAKSAVATTTATEVRAATTAAAGGTAKAPGASPAAAATKTPSRPSTAASAEQPSATPTTATTKASGTPHTTATTKAADVPPTTKTSATLVKPATTVSSALSTAATAASPVTPTAATATVSENGAPPPLTAYSAAQQARLKQATAKVLAYLNQQTGKHFVVDQRSQQLLGHLFQQQVTMRQIKQVIAWKCHEWRDTEFWKFVRPQTLFGPKFAQYLQEAPPLKLPKTTTKISRQTYLRQLYGMSCSVAEVVRRAAADNIHTTTQEVEAIAHELRA